MKDVLYKDLGLVDYKEAWDYQQQVFDGVIARKLTGGDGRSGSKEAMPEASGQGGQGAEGRPELIVCEHPHVYTLGKSGHEENMLIRGDLLDKIGARYYRIDRGGDITYHGPGQLVSYPILDLEALGLGLKDYIHSIEEAVIRTMAELGIEAGRSEGATGVWIPPGAKGGLRKICAIGVRASRFVTMHGLALNVNTQLEYFTYINPCGFTDRGVTSIEKELGHKADMDEVKRIFAAKFAEVFGVRLV